MSQILDKVKFISDIHKQLLPIITKQCNYNLNEFRKNHFPNNGNFHQQVNNTYYHSGENITSGRVSTFIKFAKAANCDIIVTIGESKYNLLTDIEKARKDVKSVIDRLSSTIKDMRASTGLSGGTIHGLKYPTASYAEKIGWLPYLTFLHCYEGDVTVKVIEKKTDE